MKPNKSKGCLIAVILVLGVLLLLLMFSLFPAISAAISKQNNAKAAVSDNISDNIFDNRAGKIKEALQCLANYCETPTERRLQALSQSLESCPQDFQDAVKDLFISLNKTYEDMISKQEQEDAMAGTIFLGLLAGAVSNNPGDAMSAGFQIGNAIQGEMQQKSQKRLEQEIEHKLADLIDIARKYGVDLND